MTEQDLLKRIDAAMERIRTAMDRDGEASAMFQQLGKLGKENAELKTALGELKTRRETDIAELDTLVSQLKPLIGDA